MSLNHKQKVKAARKMRTKEELGIPLFQCLAWRQRKWAVADRVRRQQVRRKYYSELKKGIR